MRLITEEDIVELEAMQPLQLLQEILVVNRPFFHDFTNLGAHTVRSPHSEFDFPSKRFDHLMVHRL